MYLKIILIYLDEVFTTGTAIGGSWSSTGTTGPTHSCIWAALRDIIFTDLFPPCCPHFFIFAFDLLSFSQFSGIKKILLFQFKVSLFHKIHVFQDIFSMLRQEVKVCKFSFSIIEDIIRALSFLPGWLENFVLINWMWKLYF